MVPPESDPSRAAQSSSPSASAGPLPRHGNTGEKNLSSDSLQKKASASKPEKQPSAQTVLKKPLPHPTQLADASRENKLNTADRRALLERLPEHVEVEGASLLFWLVALFVSFILLLIPILYLLFICASAYVVYYHATHNVWMLRMGGGKIAIFFLCAYVTPILGGIAAVFFMLKPFFARYSPVERSRQLTEAGEPLLFEFVYRIADLVGAPRPDIIAVDMDANASASFGASLFSRTLTLTLGTILIEGLRIDEFGGVVAHEFGHFCQSSSVGINSFIGRMLNWLARIVYERDEWDDWLQAMGEEEGGSFGLMIVAIQCMIYLSRCVLWCFWLLGALSTSALMKQMEFDANKFEIALAGTDTFCRTSRKIPFLAISQQMAENQCKAWFEAGHLPDDMVALARHMRTKIPKEARKAIELSIETDSSSMLATHPSVKAQIRAAEKLNAAGVFHEERPAMLLFSNFADLCKKTTWDFYREVLGGMVYPEKLTPVEALIERNGKPPGAFRKSGAADDQPIPLD